MRMHSLMLNLSMATVEDDVDGAEDDDDADGVEESM